MCVKLPPRDFNPGYCTPHFTSTYICGVTIAPRVCGDKSTEITITKHYISPFFSVSYIVAMIFLFLLLPKTRKSINHFSLHMCVCTHTKENISLEYHIFLQQTRIFMTIGFYFIFLRTIGL